MGMVWMVGRGVGIKGDWKVGEWWWEVVGGGKGVERRGKVFGMVGKGGDMWSVEVEGGGDVG